MNHTQPTAAIVIIGNEILSGRTVDANVPYLARRFVELGVELAEVRIVPDVLTEIVAAVNACRSRYTYVITTGGIGPTHDDITTKAIAAAFDVPVVRDPEAERRLGSYYVQNLNAARLRMADVPSGAILINNPVSQAPGYQIGNVYVLAGVPSIAQAMFEEIVSRLPGGPTQATRNLVTALPESQFADALAAIQTQFPEVQIGSYPFAKQGRYGVTLVLRSTDVDRLEAVQAKVHKLLTELGDTPTEN